MVKSRDSSPTAWVWAWLCHLLTVGHDWATQQQQLPLTSCGALGNVLNFSVPQLPSSVKWEWKCYLPRQLLGGLMTCFSESSGPDIPQALPTAEWVAVPLPLFVACSVVQSCPTLCDPMDCSTPGSPVLHHLPEFAQIHVHWVGDAI